MHYLVTKYSNNHKIYLYYFQGITFYELGTGIPSSIVFLFLPNL